MQVHGSRENLVPYSVKIVSKNGISTDMEKINVIVKLPCPINAKGVQ